MREFDQFFRDRLEGYSPAVPEDMWERIDRRRLLRRRMVFWWMFGGAGLLVGGIFVLCFFMGGRKDNRFAMGKERQGSEEIVRGGKGSVAGGKDSAVRAEGKDFVRTEGMVRTEQMVKTEAVARTGGMVRTEQMAKTGSKEKTRSKRKAGGVEDAAAAGNTGNAETAESSERTGNSGGPKRAGKKRDIRAIAPPGLALLKARLPVKPPPLASPKNNKRSEPPQQKQIGVDGYVSPEIPHTLSRNGLSYAAGLRVHIPVYKNFSLIAGVQYLRLEIKQQADSNNISPPRDFNNIEFPLLIGYTASFDQWRLGINGGIITNIRSRPGGGTSLFNSYVNSTRLSLYLGCELSKPLNPHWTVFAEPFFRYQASDRHLIPSGQAANAAGLSVGLRYNFKWGRQQK